MTSRSTLTENGDPAKWLLHTQPREMWKIYSTNYGLAFRKQKEAESHAKSSKTKIEGRKTENFHVPAQFPNACTEIGQGLSSG